MITYRENTPAVHARQWDGTELGAQEMFNFLRKLDLSGELEYKKVFFLDGDEFGESSGLNLGYTSGIVNPTCWVVIDEGKNVTVFTDANFQDRFHQVVT